MPSVEAFMVMLASLVLCLLVALFVFPFFTGVVEEISFGGSYQMTQQVVSTINLLSASTQNESAIIKINPMDFTIKFDGNYIESSVSFMGDGTYGSFIFPDINLNAPAEITGDSSAITKLLIKKEYINDEVYIDVSEIL